VRDVCLFQFKTAGSDLADAQLGIQSSQTWDKWGPHGPSPR